MAKKDKKEKAEEQSGWLETVLVVIGALVLALLIQQFLVKPYKRAHRALSRGG